MDKIYHVLQDLEDRAKRYREESAECFMERNVRRQHFCRDVATGIEQAIEVIRDAYEEHPAEE